MISECYQDHADAFSDKTARVNLLPYLNEDDRRYLSHIFLIANRPERNNSVYAIISMVISVWF